MFQLHAPSHRASECRSTSTGKHCNKRHHTSICDAPKEIKPVVMTASKHEDKEVVFSIMPVEIDGHRSRKFLCFNQGDQCFKQETQRSQTKRIEMTLTSSTTRVKIYSANIKSLDGKFNMNVELSREDKVKLMSVKNPQYNKLLEKYNHPKGAKFEDLDTRPGIDCPEIGSSEVINCPKRFIARKGRPALMIYSDKAATSQAAAPSG